MITLKNMPMPPSANALYSTVSRDRRVKSVKYLEYIQKNKLWIYKNSLNIINSKEEISKIQKNQALHVDHIFYFRKSSIITKKNTIKKNDTSNRLKAIDDFLSEILNIDDCFFWSGSYEKQSINEYEHEYCDVKIKIINI